MPSFFFLDGVLFIQDDPFLGRCLVRGGDVGPGLSDECGVGNGAGLSPRTIDARAALSTAHKQEHMGR